MGSGSPISDLPCLVFEDEHLLVVNKPAGVNTHAPSPFAGEGLYDWLKNREPRWAHLAIVHRLDKETSGLIVFGKSQPANRSLTAQFAGRQVRKKYLLLTDRPVPRRDLTIKTGIVRAGDHYVSRPSGEPAETRFRTANFKSQISNSKFLVAEPLTGRTHQVRVHAAANGFPILGDVLYGGSPFPRVCLHAAELAFRHPVSGRELSFHAPVDFEAETRAALRSALIDSPDTDVFRIVHGASDGWPGGYVDRLGSYLLSQSARDPGPEQERQLRTIPGIRGVYHKTLSRCPGRVDRAGASPRLLLGEPAPAGFTVRENGVLFEIRFNEGSSCGLFLDQRDNRRRLLTGHIAAGFELVEGGGAGDRPRELLNTFAYTCGFSVCAAKSGLRTTSVDLSRKYIDWGKRNFVRNGLDPAAHDFIFGDVVDWLRRFEKRRRQFDVIVVDPPTFSQSKSSGVFRAETDYGSLVSAALRVLNPGGVLFASCNAAGWSPDRFLGAVEMAVCRAGRAILRKFYAPQPPDFPVSREEPAYLKTVWLRVS